MDAVNTVLEFRLNWVGDLTKSNACSVFDAVGRPADFPQGVLVPLLRGFDSTTPTCPARRTDASSAPGREVAVDSITLRGDSATAYLTVYKGEQAYRENYHLVNRMPGVRWGLHEVRVSGAMREYRSHPPSPQSQPTECVAQSDSVAVISAALSSIYGMVQRNRDTVFHGPIAFDPRALRADRGPAPGGWPDLVGLRWAGDVRSSSFSPQLIQAVLGQANHNVTGAMRWVACGDSPGVENCDPRRYSAVVAVSEPLVCGDVAQVLASIRYWSTDTLHPSTWQASVLRLRRAGGKWGVEAWANQASN